MSAVPEEIASAERQLDREAKALDSLGSSVNVNRRRNLEARYGHAYNRLVQLGARAPIRKKYRRITR